MPQTDTPGANGCEAGHGEPLLSRLVVKGLDGVAGGLPLYGVSCDIVVYVPHACGLLRTAFGPPRKRSLNSLNGSSGRESKVAVSWPVSGSALTCPFSLTSSPNPWIS